MRPRGRRVSADSNPRQDPSLSAPDGRALCGAAARRYPVEDAIDNLRLAAVCRALRWCRCEPSYVIQALASLRRSINSSGPSPETF
jgi:hypothetical protein